MDEIEKLLNTEDTEALAKSISELAKQRLNAKLTKEKLDQIIDVAIEKALSGNLGFFDSLMDRIGVARLTKSEQKQEVNTTNSLLIDESVDRVKYVQSIIASKAGAGLDKNKKKKKDLLLEGDIHGIHIK